MIVLKATEKQFNELNGYTNGAAKLMFITDKHNNYVVGTQVLEDESFIEIKSKLLELEEIEYVPPINNIES